MSSLVLSELTPCPFRGNSIGHHTESYPEPAVIFEDNQIYVYLTRKPLGGLPGHTLVTVKRHVETLDLLEPEESDALWRGVLQGVRAVRAALDPEGVLVQQNNGVAAFQTIPHVHVHVIPKRPDPYPPAVDPPFTTAENRAETKALIQAHWQPA